MSVNIGGMRKPYHDKQDVFDFDHLKSKDPFEQFRFWFDEAVANEDIHEANAMSLATATKSGLPSVRIVLLKEFSPRGFVFFTNYESRKGKELAENPHCSLMFYWDAMKRAVRVEGRVERVSKAESETYFNSRPRDSQLGALASRQSTVIPDREFLDKKHEELQEEYADETKVIPKPDYWGGFCVIPKVIEFWQGQSTRLHDRIVFRREEEGETTQTQFTHKGENGWVIQRLSP